MLRIEKMIFVVKTIQIEDSSTMRNARQDNPVFCPKV